VVQGATAAKQLSTALGDVNPTVQLFAVRKLIDMKTNVDEVVASLRQLLQSGTLEHRAEAAWLLGDIGPGAIAVLPELVAILQSKDDAICHDRVLAITNPLKAVRKLLAVEMPAEIEILTDFVGRVMRIPNSDELQIEIDLIELLTQQGYADKVLRSYIVRIPLTRRVAKQAQVDSANTAISAYKSAAIRIWNTLDPTQKAVL